MRKTTLIQSLNELLCNNNLTQHCTEHTHNRGSVLDAIMAHENSVTIDHILPVDWSDNHIILFHINQTIQCLPRTQDSTHSMRNLRQIPLADLEERVSSLLPITSCDLSATELTSHYNAVMTSILDQIAPLKQKRVRNLSFQHRPKLRKKTSKSC